MVRQLLLFALFTLLPLSALAQAPTDEDRAAAREAYARGQQLHRDGQYAEAETAFQEAYSHIPNPVVLLGIAEARERAGDVPGTIEILDQYLAERTDAPDRAEVEERLTRLRATPATLAVASEPAGASVSLDGADTGRVTPVELEVQAGSHMLALSNAGFDDAERTVEVGPGAREDISVTLVATVPDDGIEGVGDPIEEVEPEGEGEETDADDGPSAGVWVTTGLAAASLVGGTVLGFMALSKEADFDDEPSDGTADDGERFALFADVLFGVAAAAAITAIVLFLTDKAAADDEEESEEEATASLRVAPVITPRSGGVTAEVRF